VGKTTCAAARAVLEAAHGARVLVASTDPAHSLGDALMARLSSSPQPIAGRESGRRAGATNFRGTLHAVELNARHAFARWLARHRAALGEVIEHGTWLDHDDVEALLDLPLPGIDELAGMLELVRLGRIDLDVPPPSAAPERRSGRRRATGPPAYDTIVVDTAPTGHTLRLLASPDAVLTVAHALEDLQQEHRMVRERFARVWRPDAADRLIALLAAQAARMAEVLRDGRRTTFHWVMLPEVLSLAESEKAMTAIEERGIRIAHVIVNRALPRGPRCRVCDARRQEERRVVTAVARRLGPRRTIRIVSAHLREPRGFEALTVIGRETMASRPARVPAAGRRRRPAAGMVLSVPAASRQRGCQPTTVEALPSFHAAELLLVAGKGGVGKTTIAAAIALRLARASPDRRTLLLSTDPAHSLGHVFEVAAGMVGDEPGRVPHGPANLLVREVDAVAALNARRVELERAFDEVAASLGAGQTGRRGAELLELAPPGIDELFGMLSIVEASRDLQQIVVDMAPTGHALRLLEQPGAAREWVRTIMRVLLKYRSFARSGQLAQELLMLSKSIRQLQELLHDRARTRIVVVTRAAQVPRLETERLLSELRRRRLSASVVVANALTLAPGRCVRCRRTAAAERVELRALRGSVAAKARGSAIIETALAAPPPRGVAALEQWAAQWLFVAEP